MFLGAKMHAAINGPSSLTPARDAYIFGPGIESRTNVLKLSEKFYREVANPANLLRKRQP